jgi:hypothetical protein
MPIDRPFDQARNAAAITTFRARMNGFPILTVAHYADDHSWAFLCGTSDSECCRRSVVLNMV